jgi:hypothetical protein
MADYAPGVTGPGNACVTDVTAFVDNAISLLTT